MTTLIRNSSPLWQKMSIGAQNARAQAVHSREHPFTQGKKEGGSFFMAASLAVHLGAIVFFSSVPGPAHAHSVSPQEIEISVFAPEPPKEALPLGNLEEEFIAKASVQHVVQKAAVPAPTRVPTNSRSEQGAPVETPHLLTSNNPYAQGNNHIFTSGSGVRSNQGAHALAKTDTNAQQRGPTPNFGIQNGSKDFSKKKAEALRAWHQKVRSQLAHLGGRAYPRRAKKMGHQGTSKISVRINAQGKIVSATVAQASGYQLLDNAALSSLRTIPMVAAPPAGTGTTQLTIPVTFRLR